MSHTLSPNQLQDFSKNLNFFEMLLFNSFNTNYQTKVELLKNFRSSSVHPSFSQFSDINNFQVGMDEYFHTLNKEQPFVFSDIHQFLNVVDKHFINSPIYPLLHLSVLQSFAKNVKQDYNWSLLEITQTENLDINLIKEGIKQAFSLPFSVHYDNAVYSSHLFGFGLLCLNNTSNTSYSRKDSAKSKQISLFNEEQTFDIAKTLFKYHPTFIFSIRHFGCFSDLSGSNFLPFFSKVWDMTQNTLTDTLGSSAFTPFFHLLEPPSLDENFKEIENNFYMKTFISYALQGSHEQVLKKLNELKIFLSASDGFFNCEKNTYPENVNVAGKIHISNLSLDDHRIFFTHIMHPEIFNNEYQQSNLLFVENTIREINLVKDMSKINKSSSHNKKNKI